MIWYFIIGYFVIGVILNFVGPAGKTANEAIKEIDHETFKDFIKKKRIRKGIAKLCIVVIILIVILLFWPVLYFLLLHWDYFFGPMSKDRKAVKKLSKGLFFQQMGGAGHIACNNCGYHQSLVSFIHSFPMESWNEAGFQCQECVKFHKIENYLQCKNSIKCDCGGILSRDEVLFCPECRSNNLKYLMEYIT